MDTNTMQYNTKRDRLILPEYGRNVQQMVNYCMSIEDRDERNRCARAIVKNMCNLFPEECEGIDGDKVFWDHINIISNFKLDVDFPVEVITEKELNLKPNRLQYNNNRMLYRYYGKTIENIIEKVAVMENNEEKDLLISMIAHHMKKLMLVHNKEGIDNGKILRDLALYSKGKIKLDPETYLLHDFQEAEEVIQEQGKKKKKK